MCKVCTNLIYCSFWDSLYQAAAKRAVFCFRWCDFFQNCHVARGRWWLHLATNFDEVCDFVAKNSTVWISRDFFLIFFQLLHPLCEGGYKWFLLHAGNTTIFKKNCITFASKKSLLQLWIQAHSLVHLWEAKKEGVSLWGCLSREVWL